VRERWALLDVPVAYEPKVKPLRKDSVSSSTEPSLKRKANKEMNRFPRTTWMGSPVARVLPSLVRSARNRGPPLLCSARLLLQPNSGTGRSRLAPMNTLIIVERRKQFTALVSKFFSHCISPAMVLCTTRRQLGTAMTRAAAFTITGA
jgi:hypothetical protein